MGAASCWGKNTWLYCLAATAIIVFLYRDNVYSGSVDLAWHYKMVMTALGEEMWFAYPPLPHMLAAMVGNVVGSNLLAMNILLLLSFSTVYLVFSWFLLQVNAAALVLFGLGMSLLLALYVPLPIIGFEIIGNFFFSQLIAHAYILLVLLLLYKYRISIQYQIAGLILAVVVGFYIFPLVAIVLFCASLITLLLEHWQGTNWRQLSIYLAFFAASIVAAFVLNPYTRSMASIANINGHLPFAFFSNTPVDISIEGRLLIVVALVFSLCVLWTLRKRNLLIRGRDRVRMFVAAVVCSASCLAVAQYGLMILGQGSIYAVKISKRRLPLMSDL